MTQSCTYTENAKKAITGRGQRHEQGESTTTVYQQLSFTSTYTVLLIETRRHIIHSKEKRAKTPSQTRESDGVRGPL